MELTEKHVPGAAIVAIHGKLVGTPQNCESMHNVFRSLLESGKRHIIVDLEDAPWANSQGIGMLIGAHTSVVKAGGKLALLNANDRISAVLAVTKLDRVFNTFQNEGAAVRYMTGQDDIDPEARSQATV